MAQPISVLLVDDNPTFLSIVVEFLSSQADLIVIGTAQGGQQALRLTREIQPDVVLLDLNLTDLHGLEVIPHLRELRPDLGIIVLTWHNADSYYRQALAAGADDFVHKPKMYTDLASSIRQVGRGTRRASQ